MASRGRGLVLDKLLSKSSKLPSPPPHKAEVSFGDDSKTVGASRVTALPGTVPGQRKDEQVSAPSSQSSTRSPATVGGIGRGYGINKLMTPDQFKTAVTLKSEEPNQNESLTPQSISELGEDDVESDSGSVDVEFSDSKLSLAEEVNLEGKNDDAESNSEGEDESSEQEEEKEIEKEVKQLQEKQETVPDEKDQSQLVVLEDVGEAKLVEKTASADIVVDARVAATNSRVPHQPIARIVPTVGHKPIQPPLRSAEVQQAELEWNKLKLERKLKKLIGGISDDTLDDVMRELPILIRDKTFGTEKHNCNVILTILFEKATRSVSVLPFVACLLKHLADISYTCVKACLPPVIDTLANDLVKVVKGNKVISEGTERLCSILGTLFTFPVVYNESFHSLIYPLVSNCVNAWSYTKAVKAPISGHRLDVALVHTYALGHLLRRISLRLRDDKKPLAEMAEFVKSVRNSVLNEYMPRQLRNVYLEILLAEANEWPEDMFPNTTIDIHVAVDEPSAPDEATIDDQSAPRDNPSSAQTAPQSSTPSPFPATLPPSTTILQTASTPELLPSLKMIVPPIEAPALASAPSVQSAAAPATALDAAPADPYAEITRMLTELGLLSELERFKGNVIRDVSLRSHSDSIRALFKEADFPVGLTREALWYLKDKGICKDSGQGNPMRPSSSAYRSPRNNGGVGFRGRAQQHGRAPAANSNSWRQPSTGSSAHEKTSNAPSEERTEAPQTAKEPAPET